MSETPMSTPSGQDREGAAAAMRDLPGETALGHVDPATSRAPTARLRSRSLPRKPGSLPT